MQYVCHLEKVSYEREFINFKLLVFERMGIIKSPLVKQDMSVDKVNQTIVLLV